MRECNRKYNYRAEGYNLGGLGAGVGLEQFALFIFGAKFAPRFEIDTTGVKIRAHGRDSPPGYKATGGPFEVEFIGLPGDEIPLEDKSVDTLLLTYTLSTIPVTTPPLRQMSRVLRRGGELIFCEHGAAPDASVRRWAEASESDMEAARRRVPVESADPRGE